MIERYSAKNLIFRQCLNYNLTKKADVRTKITFECTECKHRNYDSYKNKRNDPDRLTISKYCPFCKKHTEHKESK